MKFFVFALFLFVGSVFAAGSSRELAGYESVYDALMQPVGLRLTHPLLEAPISPPWPRNNQQVALRNYVHHLYNHDAYIDPEAGGHLQGLHRDAASIVDNPSDPYLQEHQRRLLGSLVSTADEAKREMQIALHPANVRAQHIDAINGLYEKLNGLLHVVEQHSEQLTSRLTEHESTRFVDAHLMLMNERQLLDAAKRLATSVPSLH